MIEHKGTQEIETQRLILRKFEISDAYDMFYTWANDDEVTKYMRWEPHKSVEETREVLTHWISKYEKPKIYHWGIVLKENNQLIGSLGIEVKNEYDFCAEAGYCIGQKFWGKGYTAEALRAVFHYMFFEVGLNRIEACHSVENPASGRVMQKAGMTFEGMARQKYRCRLGFQDSNMYAILKEDWK